MINKKHIASTYLLFLFGLTLNLNAQSIESLLAELNDANLELKILETQYDAALQKGTQVSQMPGPEFGLGLAALPVETRLGAQWFKLSGSQMLPPKGSLKSKANVEDAKANIQLEQIGTVKLQRRHQLRLAYFELFQLQKTKNILKEKRTAYDALERLANIKIESNRASVADVLQIQLKKKSLEKEIKSLENKEAIPTAHINFLLNKNESTTYTTTTLQLATENNLMNNEIQNEHPTFRTIEAKKKLSESELERNNYTTKPIFGVGLDYAFVDKRKDANPNGNGRDILMPKAMVKIPLGKKQLEAKKEEERIKMTSFELEKAHYTKQFEMEIQKALVEIKEAQLNWDLANEQIQLTESIVEVLIAKYTSKGNNFEEIIRIQNQLIEFEITKIKAIVQSLKAKARIEQFTNQSF